MCEQNPYDSLRYHLAVVFHQKTPQVYQGQSEAVLYVSPSFDGNDHNKGDDEQQLTNSIPSGVITNSPLLI